MHLFRKILMMGLVGLGLGWGACSASANTVSALVTPSSISKLTDWHNKLFTVEQFDPALGTLTSVDIKLSGQLDGSVNLKNKNTDEPANYNFTLQIDFASTLPNGSILVTVASGAQVGILGPSGTTSLNNIFATNSTSQTLVSNLGAFIGDGTFTVPTNGVGTVNNFGSSNITLDVTSIGTATLEVDYNYGPSGVPLPASIWSGGILLAGIAYRRFRKMRE